MSEEKRQKHNLSSTSLVCDQAKNTNYFKKSVAYKNTWTQ